MRTYWLGLIALLLTAGCTHDGNLRPLKGAVPLTENGTAATLTEQGVTLVAYGSTWKGVPHDLGHHFTPVEIRLENHSDRTLSIRYDDFTLDGRNHYVARNPNELGQLMAGKNTTYRPRQNNHTGTYQAQSGGATRMQPTHDTSYPSNNSIPSYKAPPCYTCTPLSGAVDLPTPDMLRQAFSEGPLDEGQIRKGFLYFEEPLQLDDSVTLKVTLVDESTGEPFGSLSIPFEVY